MLNEITNWIKKYWIELIVFSAIGGVTLLCASPDYTWINTDSDGIHYTYAAKYLYPSHKSSSPLYLLLGRLFLYLPFGTDAWKMSLISVISGLIGSIFIYLIIKEKLGNKAGSKWYGLVGSILYGGGALVLSQNTIVETYPLATTLGIITYYYVVRSKWKTSAIFIGMAGAVHPISLITSGVLLVKFKELRMWKPLIIAACFIIFYAYIPLTNREPFMWNTPNETGGVLGFMSDTISTAGMLSGGLSIWDFPKRILDTIGQLIVSWGIGIVALLFIIRINGKWDSKWYKNEIVWLTMLPVLYYAGNMAPQTYVYMQPGIAFGCIAIGIGLTKIRKEWLYATGIAGCLVLGFNANYFDIGRTLDKDLSAVNFYYKELNKVPDGEVLLAQQGWEWACIFKYNKEFGRDIIPICVGTLPSETYRKLWLDRYDIKYELPNGKYTANWSELIALSILESNDNIWATEATEPKTYGARVIKADSSIISRTSQGMSHMEAMDKGVWTWKPSNPYDIITGAIEVEEWQYIIISNYSVYTFTIMGGTGLVMCWLGWQIVVKKKKWNYNKAKDGIVKAIK